MLPSWYRIFLPRLFILAGAIFGGPAAALVAGPGPQDRLDWMRNELLKSLHDFQRRPDTPKTDGTCSTNTSAGYYALTAGTDTKVAEDFIRRAVARQEMDPNSPRTDQELNHDLWRVKLTEPGDAGNPQSALVSMNLVTGRPLDRRMDGAEYVVDRFSVNERDLAAEILDPLKDGSGSCVPSLEK
jgi:hypothetical protein